MLPAMQGGATQGKAGRLAAAATLALMSVFLLGGVGRTTNFDSRLLAAHNRERTAAGIAALEWDGALAADAAEWARYLAELNDLEHSPDDPDEMDPQGENLWLGTQSHFSPEDMVVTWIEEKRHFKPGIFPDNSRTGDLDDIGHYTQLMWRDTERVGCAVEANGEYDILVCRYSAAGNVIGERPF
jgi:cysteine-rich secretory family protein